MFQYLKIVFYICISCFIFLYLYIVFIVYSLPKLACIILSYELCIATCTSCYLMYYSMLSTQNNGQVNK